MREHRDWLLILDNAEEGVPLDFQLGMAARGHIVVTTRLQKIAERGQSILLEKLPVERAALLLLRIIHGKSASTVLEDFPVAEREEALALAGYWTGCHWHSNKLVHI